MRLVIEAPAKINLHLRVGGLRPDGFHELESVFAALQFGDTLVFETLPQEGALELRCPLPEFPRGALPEALPPEKNLIWRAVSLFRARSGFQRGLRVRAEKRIPLGGGLGGGSSDAAASLLALNSLAGRPLDQAALLELAAELGSDAPFFLAKSAAALVWGRGEAFEALEGPQNTAIVLVNPGFPSSTAAAFRLLDQYRAGRAAQDKFPGPDRAALKAALAKNPREWPYANDFLPVFLARGGAEAAAYRAILQNLEGEGADFASLSGSGSTCFGVFSDLKKAKKAAAILLKSWEFTKITFLLAHKGNAVLE
jgi:4-diphosphocytidyl-2-C-methyl-D-erythritol kinase